MSLVYGEGAACKASVADLIPVCGLVVETVAAICAHLEGRGECITDYRFFDLFPEILAQVIVQPVIADADSMGHLSDIQEMPSCVPVREQGGISHCLQIMYRLVPVSGVFGQPVCICACDDPV